MCKVFRKKLLADLFVYSSFGDVVFKVRIESFATMARTALIWACAEVAIGSDELTDTSSLIK